MPDEAIEILDFLPQRRDQIEDEYILHLWDTFVALASCSGSERGFAIMPYHLLFMLSVQYKVLRIYKELNERYSATMTISKYRDRHKETLNPDAVTTIAYFDESDIINLLRIVEIDEGHLGKIKSQTVQYRNDSLAHAKGYIELNLDQKIHEYLSSISYIQELCDLKLNTHLVDILLANLLSEDDIDVFIETNLLEHRLCQKDLLTTFTGIISKQQLTTDQLSGLVSLAESLLYEEENTKLLNIIIPII